MYNLWVIIFELEVSAVRVSVALAAYKGEKFIEEQLRSILSQLGKDDEIVVSDDCPGSTMSELVIELAKTEPRVRYFEGPCQGVVKNFEHAISKTSGDIIFLCDQDDAWLPGKVAAVKAEIENGASLVLHDAKVADADLKVYNESFFKSHGSKSGYINNVLKNSFMGCCMAFDKDLKEYILPFPKDIPMHDQYIGLKALKLENQGLGKVVLLDTPYILYRQHGNNVTGGKTSLKDKIRWRIAILIATIK